MKKVLHFFLVFGAVWITAMGLSLLHPGFEKLFFKNPVQSGFTALRMPDFYRWSETKNDKPKLLILGSSTAYRGIDPAAFESKYNAFNLSSSSQTLYQSKKLLELAIAQNDSLHTVIVDIFPENWDFPTTESTLDLIVNNPKVSDKTFRQMAFEDFDIKAIYLWTYGWVKSKITPNAWSIESTNQFEVYHSSGFVESSANLKPVHLKERTRPVLLTRYISDLVAISTICSDNNITLHFLIPPQIKPTQYIFNKIKPIPNYIQGNEVALKRSDFIDNHHLNASGAKKYSQWLFNQVKQP